MPWDGEGAERTLGSLLRIGVIVSAAVVLGAGIWYLRRSGLDHPGFRTFRGEPKELCSVPAIVSHAFNGDPRSLLQLGMLLLIATPLARVALSVGMFLLERDRLYVVLTLIVFAVLLSSLFWPV